MFKINTNRRSLSSIPLITDNYEVIHFDDIPYLYFGTNEYGSKVIGSLLMEDEETDNLRYVHTLVNNNTFNKFISQQIPYRKIIEESTDLYIIDKNFNEKPIAIYSVSHEVIPTDFLPVADYFCPKYNFAVGNDFVLSLHGNIADAHLAFPVELSKIQKGFEKVLNTTLEVFENLNMTPVVKQRAYSSGSFQLRFNISFAEFKELFIKQESLYNSVSTIIKNLIPNADQETNSVNQVEQFIGNPKIIDNLKTILEPSGVTINDEFISRTKDKFEKVIGHYKDLSSNLGHGYNEIELLVEKRDSKQLVPIQLINSENQFKLEEIVTIIDSKKYKVEKDAKYREYKIAIYALNVDSRVGRALIFSKDNPDSMDKPNIKIGGKEPLEKSIYTESLHLNKWITVKAMATMKNDTFNKLIIESE